MIVNYIFQIRSQDIGIWFVGRDNLLSQVSYDPRSYERNLSKYVKKPEKVRTSSGFELVTSRYPVRRSNQLSYDVIDVGSWSFVGSNEPVRKLFIKYFIYNFTFIPHGFKPRWSPEFFRLLYAIA